MLAEGVGYGKSGVGMERFVDFHLRVEKLTRYYVPSHHTPIWVLLFRATLFFYYFFSVLFLDHNGPFQEHSYREKGWKYKIITFYCF